MFSKTSTLSGAIAVAAAFFFLGATTPWAPGQGGPGVQIATAASDCPCDFLGSLEAPFTWADFGFLSCDKANVYEGVPGGDFSLVGGDRNVAAALVIFQDENAPHGFGCERVANADEGVLERVEPIGGGVFPLDHCIADVIAVSTALGVSCPEPPIWILP